MKIQKLFKRPSDLYTAISAENVERRDAEPFYSFDTDVPKVQPLWDKESRFEIYERPISRKAESAGTKKVTARRRPKLAAKQTVVAFKFEQPKTLLLPAGEQVKLLKAGKQQLLLPAPDEVDQVISRILETQHVVYFSDVEFRNGAEIITEDKVVRERRRNFLGAKIVGALLMLFSGATILFPPTSLRAAKMDINVNPTNTTPGLSLSVSSADMTVVSGEGKLPIQTQANQLATSTLGLDVSTTGADGYKMYMTTNGTDKKGNHTNALVNTRVNGSNEEGVKINALTADVQQSAFPVGYWGYTTATSIQDSTIFKPFPNYDATDTVLHGGVEVAGANMAVADDDSAGETPFTIGVKADGTLPAGDYTNELLFTVIANPVTVTYNLSFDGNTDDDTLMGVPTTVTVASADVFRDVTIPADVPTRDKYAFIGWANTADATEVVYAPGDDVTMQVTNINDAQVVNKTLYAVWEEIPDDTKLMQDFNDAIDLRTVGDVDTYKDSRDNKTYTVARLADGKVWMTQNIAYETGATQMSSDYGGYYLRANANSICPAGWHLPSTAEFSALDRAYGGAGTGKNANAPSYNSLAGEPAKWTLSGFYRTTNTQYGEIGWDQVGVNGYYMASDVNTVYAGNIMTANIVPETRTVWMDANTTANTYATNIRCVGDQPNTFYIQDFNENTMLPHTGDMATLTDKRDGETYNVTRLADGNVWMTQNLRLNLTAGETLTSENTDAPANGLYVDYTTRTAGGVAWDRTTARSYNSGVRDYGVYYNWYSATAGTRSDEYSICPSGWRLPSAAEYGTLMSTYSFNQTTIRNAPFYMPTSDHYNDAGTVYNRGTLGHLWTSTTNGTDNAYFMFFNASSINNMATHSQAYGFAVRCVARDDVKVLFDANGGTGTMAMQSFMRGIAQTLSANTFERAGYEFAGWATAPDATTAKYTDKQLVTFSKVTKLYAVWKTNYIQDFDAKTMLLDTGDATTLVDERDGKAYAVKRLADGKVWMTQNLAYATGATIAPNARGGYYSWSAAQNVCPTGWHLPASSEYAGMYDNYSSVTTFTTDGPELGFDGRWMISSNSYQYVDSAGYYWNSTNADEAFSFNNNGQVWLTYTYLSTSYSNQVRCIANEQETVSFNANGGTGTMADVTVEKGGSVTLTNEFTNPAYNFIGWATSADGEKVYDDGATITLIEDLALYALWEPKGEFMQDFNQDTELLTVSNTKTLYDNRDGNAYTVRRLDDGKVWMTKDLGYTDNGKYKTGNFGAYYNWNDALIVCPAGWHIIDKEEVKALDLAWGGTGVSRDSANTYTHFTSMDYLNLTFGGRYFGSPTMRLQRVGTEAIYWTGNESVTDPNSGNNLLLNSNGRLDFYDTSKSIKARYEQPVRCIADYEEVTVTFDTNGGSGTVPAAITKVTGQSITIPTNALARTGYEFLGWATSASATTPEYTDGETITVMEDMTLYAVWETIVAFTSNNLTWTKVLGDAPFSSASTLCPSGYHIPTRAQLRALIGASSDGVWVSGSMVNYLYNIWNQPHMVWSSDVYNSTGAYDLFFRDGQAIITATSTPSSPAQVVCVK